MWDGERLETSRLDRVAIEHLHRYAISLDYVQNKTVLDIASGEGYGTFLLSNEANYVYGVDISPEAIDFAKAKYSKNNIEFKVGSTSTIPLDDSSVDVVVSYETIEHHDQHDEMMMEIKRVLKPDGVLIISSPDKLVYSDKRNYQNEFHIKELYKHEFVDLLSNNFKNIQLLSQLYINGNSLVVPDIPKKNIEIFNGNFSRINKTRFEAMFLIIIASEVDLKFQNVSIFNGNEIIGNVVKREIKRVKESQTFKIGTVILKPLRIIKGLLKT